MLKDYRSKRDFARTPEPAPQARAGEGPLLFVVQKHAARQLHYDFRLEVDGALKSWSVPHGPSLNPADKRLAVMVEDHPLDYASFEGVIPRGEYGAGEVIVWDTGSYSPETQGETFFHDRARAEAMMREGLAGGKLSLTLHGHKLKGSWALVKMARREKEWLLIKHPDEAAAAERDILEESKSVLSGLGIDDLRAGRRPDPPPLVSLPGSRAAAMPASLAPMLATPVDAPFADPAWAFEPKLDGYRTIAFIDNGKVRLKSRRQLDVTTRYPYLAEDLRRQPGQVVFDGEIVALDEGGRPCFQCLQRHLEGPAPGAPEIPIVYYVFDILYLDGFSLTGVALEQRRRLLERVLRVSDHVRLIEQFAADGPRVYESAVAVGFEGVLAKKIASAYEPGRRSRSWLKIKAVQSDDFIIAGFTGGAGNRAGTFGALLLGYYDEAGSLVYAGHVGSGFDEAALAGLRRRLDAIKTGQSPFAAPPPPHGETTWVRLELVAEVKFAQWTDEGYLRAPVFLRLREDKDPAEVRRSAPAAQPTSAVKPPVPDAAAGVKRVLEQIEGGGENPTIEVEGHRLGLTNLGKALWPPLGERPALAKRDLLLYLARVSPYLLPHLRDRPLSLTRFPNGIAGERFFQKHIDPLPEFVQSVRLYSEHEGASDEYLLCHNLATLLWLGQLADIEIHTWFSRVNAAPDPALEGKDADDLANYPDFIIFDLDPYIYSGHEAKNAEPELNRAAFARTAEVALWLKEVLDALGLAAFVKTSGRTGLHVHVPVVREFDFRATRSAAQTIGSYLMRRHPGKITADWVVDRRTGMVFFDANQNVRGKTLASAYSPRPTIEATVSTPLAWDEVARVYPTDFTMLTVPERLARVGDLWADILDSRRGLKAVLGLKEG